MASNCFGRILTMTTAGESHGPGMYVIIDGCPAGVVIDHDFIQMEMDRRKPGQSSLTTTRKEADQIQVLAGVYEGKTTGAPIMLSISNQDTRSSDYDQLQRAYRPSHADFTYHHKYGLRDHRGGGRSSARETANWVAAGAIAKLILQPYNINIRAGVTAVGPITAESPPRLLDWLHVEENAVRCPDPIVAQKMIEFIQAIKTEGDTVGGVISCVIEGCPPGLGEPVFSKLHADLGKAMLTINACKGFEYGSGFSGAKMKGSEHNDSWIRDGERMITKTNHSGGIQGGISNGMPIYFNVAFKPVSTLMMNQSTLDTDGDAVELEGKGRHDPCVVPRAVPIVEALAALVIADHLLLSKIYI